MVGRGHISTCRRDDGEAQRAALEMVAKIVDDDAVSGGEDPGATGRFEHRSEYFVHRTRSTHTF